VGVHCGIYKSSYNVSNASYLNSHPPLLSFIPLPHSWNGLNKYYFCIYIPVYIFLLYERRKKGRIKKNIILVCLAAVKKLLKGTQIFKKKPEM
jgi:hypothetical protein